MVPSLGQIYQFIWNLPGKHTLPVHANRDSWCGENNASRRNSLCAIQIGGFLRRFAQRSEETWLWEVLVESGASSFSRARIVRHRTVNPCGSSILVKDRNNHICDHDKLAPPLNFILFNYCRFVQAGIVNVLDSQLRGTTGDDWSNKMTEFVSPGSSGNQLQFLQPLFELWADPVVLLIMSLHQPFPIVLTITRWLRSVNNNNNIFIFPNHLILTLVTLS